MITAGNGTFTLTTRDTSYIMRVRGKRYMEHLHYGRKVMPDKGCLALIEKYNNPYGNAVTVDATVTDKEDRAELLNVTLDCMALEFSNPGTGDYRSLPLIIEDEKGCISTRLYYEGSEVYEGTYKNSDSTGMPYAGRNAVREKYVRKTQDEDTIHTLEITLGNHDEGEGANLKVKLIYTVFENYNVITRRTVVINDTSVTYTIRDISSMMLDMQGRDYRLKTFDGLWTRERHAGDKKLVSGIYETGSFNGTSSNAHNPFIILSDTLATENNGDCYAFNLIYSGNHRERVEVSEYGKVRILTGISSYGFAHKLQPGGIFHTPEAVMTYSHLGYNGVSHNMHGFVTEHIIPEGFKNSTRPVLVNNWEATYFDFNKRKLLKLADEAAKLGIELFVLDDGWFAERNDDTTSLGDWTVNEKKLGGTLKSLVDEIKDKGLKFGIWVEPEMISKKSRLYEAHPDWAVTAPGLKPYLGRNQYILDYTRQDVRDYIVGSLTALLKSADISYVKWDMNRPVTDAYSYGDSYPGTFFHDYVLGLYDVLNRLTSAFPEVLFEGCSAGGNRFDLGILSFMPQIWTSDDTDAAERMKIQGGTSYGYPPSTMGAHVSASPNHQTLRSTSIETRFDVAAMGMLGYELDLTRLSPMEKRMVKSQIRFYKEHRKLLQTGCFDRVYDKNGTIIWQIRDGEGDHAVVLLYRERSEPNLSDDVLYATGLKEDAMYRVSVRQVKIPVKTFGNLINQVSPVYIAEDGVTQAIIGKAYALDGEKEEYVVSGALLMYAGIRLNSRFIGTGLGEGTRVMGDNSSRLYTIDKLN